MTSKLMLLFYTVVLKTSPRKQVAANAEASGKNSVAVASSRSPFQWLPAAQANQTSCRLKSDNYREKFIV
jgi:hypothetical protein